MVKPKKHRWITETLKTKQRVLSVWPSKDDLVSEKKMDKFYKTIERISDDPRVVNIRRIYHKIHGAVFLFDIDEHHEPSQNHLHQ